MPADSLSTTFAALADPTRRAILARLASGEAGVTELAEPFQMSLPAISKHIKVLERAGLVARGRAAQSPPDTPPAMTRPIGYEPAADIAQEAANDNRTVRDVAGERTDLPASTLDERLDPIALSRRLGQTCREHQ